MMTMKMFERYRLSRATFSLAVMAFVLGAKTAHANVYATNLRLNDSTTSLTLPPGTPVTISYVLNEPATLGIAISIYAGQTQVRSLAVNAGDPGTQFGTNAVVWDGLDSHSNNVPVGSYSVSVTARSSGYSDWTQTTDENNPDNYVFDGRGIDIDRNTNSPFYGRVFIGNAYLGPSPETTYGDNLGILAFNADASVADTNLSVTGGYSWSGNGVSPWKVKVSADDNVYASEMINGGNVFRWDANLSSNSFLPVLRSDNQTQNASLNGPFVAGAGPNTQLWMCDTNIGSPTSRGVLRWSLAADGTCATNDKGLPVVGLGGTLGTNAPYDVALDAAGNMYVCVYTGTTSDPAQRVFRFPAYDPSTNGGQPELTSAWAVGSGDDTMGSASAIAVDPTGTYVAVAFQGAAPIGEITNGNTKIFYATNGALVASPDLGVEISGLPIHVDTACSWDAVGNLYYVDIWASQWRAVSPPGANSATTVALATVQIGNPAPPQITGITVSGGAVTITFTGAATDSASAFTLQSATSVTGNFTSASGASITRSGSGQFLATVPVSGPFEFYRIQR